ncbi:MAG: two-component sensor histidine kinase [Phycisphaeraceae bacterium]|nr:two-component sensor histidine kinase [Phycisphaeraceae bacterium]
MGSMWFWFGLATGVILTIPVAAVAARRNAARMRRLQQRSLAAERLAELGTLTGGLAHEIKNPLSTVLLHLQLLEEDLRDLEGELDDPSVAAERLGRARRRFESLTRETSRLREILEDFLRFTGRVKLARHETDVCALVEEVVDFFSPQAQAAGVHLRTQIPESPLRLDLDRGLLKQALLNLMMNACQAMSEARGGSQPSGGNDELIVRAERARGPDRQPELRMHVIDTGPGMDAETAAKVFRPYFSESRGGTGLGLPTARRIVEEHGGTIAVHSEPGRGSDFVITIPIGGGKGGASHE